MPKRKKKRREPAEVAENDAAAAQEAAEALPWTHTKYCQLGQHQTRHSYRSRFINRGCASSSLGSCGRKCVRVNKLFGKGNGVFGL